MARFVVMQKGDDALGAQFIRDGFSLPALIVPHIWLLFHRQWLAAITVISAMVLGVFAAWQTGAPLLALGVDVLVSIYVALEGATLRVANLERAGFNETAVVEAANAQEAEIRYFGDLPENAQTSVPQLKPAVISSSSAANAFAFPARG